MIKKQKQDYFGHRDPSDIRLSASFCNLEMKRWSKKYDACIECGRTDARHASHGLCGACNNKRTRRENPALTKLNDRLYWLTETYIAYRKKYMAEYYKKYKEKLDVYGKKRRKKLKINGDKS